MKGILNGILALFVLAMLCVGTAVAAKWGLSWLFDGVNPTISAAIVAAAATTIVSVLGVALGRYLERRHQIEIELRERKVPMYIEFVEGLLKVLGNGDSDEDSVRHPVDPDDDFDLVAFLRGLTPQLMIWASNDVVAKWSEFRRGAGKYDPIQYMFLLEELLTAIRKDLGHSGDLKKGDLLGLYINDIEEFVKT